MRDPHCPPTIPNPRPASPRWTGQQCSSCGRMRDARRVHGCIRAARRRFIMKTPGQPVIVEFAFLGDCRDLPTIPYVAEMPLLPSIREEERSGNGGAFAPDPADAVKSEAIGPGLAQSSPQMLTRRVFVGVTNAELRAHGGPSMPTPLHAAREPCTIPISYTHSTTTSSNVQTDLYGRIPEVANRTPRPVPHSLDWRTLSKAQLHKVNFLDGTLQRACLAVCHAGVPNVHTLRSTSRQHSHDFTRRSPLHFEHGFCDSLDAVQYADLRYPPSATP